MAGINKRPSMSDALPLTCSNFELGGRGVSAHVGVIKCGRLFIPDRSEKNSRKCSLSNTLGPVVPFAVWVSGVVVGGVVVVVVVVVEVVSGSRRGSPSSSSS